MEHEVIQGTAYGIISEDTTTDMPLNATFEDRVQNAVGKCARWYEVDKNAKKAIVDELKEMWKLYKGDHWNLTDYLGNPLRTDAQKKNRPNHVENLAFSLIEGTASEFAQDIDIIDYPVEQGDDEKAEIMTNLKKFIFQKNRADGERVKGLRWFFLYGTLIFHTPWDPEWKGGKGPNRWNGDIRFMALHPLALVPDARCKLSIQEGRRCHKVTWYTLEGIKEAYPERTENIQEQIMGEDDLIDDSTIDSEGFSDSEYRNQQVPVIETWYIGKPLLPTIDPETGEEISDPGETGLHIIWWAGEDQRVYLKHENFVNYDPDSTPEYPFQVRACYPREGSIWGYGEMYFIKYPQIVNNKTAELILEGHTHQSIGQTYYTYDAITPKQEKVIKEKGTVPGMWFQVKNAEGIKRLYGQGTPQSLQAEMSRLRTTMESIMGRFDVSQGRTPQGVTAFRAIAELSARAQVRLRIKEMAINGAYEEAGNYINRLISLHYTEPRQYRILGEPQMIEGQNKRQYNYQQYRRNDMLKVYDTKTGNVQPFEQMKATLPADTGIQMLESDQYEIYFPEFDVYSQVSTVNPSDRFYNIEVAKELLTAGLITPQIFLRVMETGRFPPTEEVIDELNRREQQNMEMQKMQMMMQMLSQGNKQAVPQGGTVAPEGGQQEGTQVQQQAGGGEDPAAIVQKAEELVMQILTPEEQELLKAMEPRQRLQAIYEILQKAEAASRGQQGQ